MNLPRWIRQSPFIMAMAASALAVPAYAEDNDATSPVVAASFMDGLDLSEEIAAENAASYYEPAQTDLIETGATPEEQAVTLTDEELALFNLGPQSMKDWAVRYYNGIDGVEINRDLALALFEEAASLGNIQAIRDLGQLEEQGLYDTSKNYRAELGLQIQPTAEELNQRFAANMELDNQSAETQTAAVTSTFEEAFAGYSLGNQTEELATVDAVSETEVLAQTNTEDVVYETMDDWAVAWREWFDNYCTDASQCQYYSEYVAYTGTDPMVDSSDVQLAVAEVAEEEQIIPSPEASMSEDIAVSIADTSTVAEEDAVYATMDDWATDWLAWYQTHGCQNPEQCEYLEAYITHTGIDPRVSSDTQYAEDTTQENTVELAEAPARTPVIIEMDIPEIATVDLEDLHIAPLDIEVAENTSDANIELEQESPIIIANTAPITSPVISAEELAILAQPLELPAVTTEEEEIIEVAEIAPANRTYTCTLSAIEAFNINGLNSRSVACRNESGELITDDSTIMIATGDTVIMRDARTGYAESMTTPDDYPSLAVYFDEVTQPMFYNSLVERERLARAEDAEAEVAANDNEQGVAAVSTIATASAALVLPSGASVGLSPR